MNQGGFYTPNYSRPRHSTSGATKTNTKLHNLANALQNAHANNTGQTGSSSAKHSHTQGSRSDSGA